MYIHISIVKHLCYFYRDIWKYFLSCIFLGEYLLIVSFENEFEI